MGAILPEIRSGLKCPQCDAMVWHVVIRRVGDDWRLVGHDCATCGYEDRGWQRKEPGAAPSDG